MKYKGYTSSPTYSYSEKIYYGGVDGVPEMGDIEASTEEVFEERFHEAVDHYLQTSMSSKSKAKWGLIITLFFIFALIVSAVISCPKKAQHVEVLVDKVSMALNEKVGDKDLLMLGSLLGNPVAKMVVTNYIDVNDYLLFSIGTFEEEGNRSVVSVGAFGHVFTASKRTLSKALDQVDF